MGKRTQLVEKEASKALLHEGEKFEIGWLGRKWKVTIKPLHLGTIIKISGYSASLKGIGEEDTMIPALLKSSGDIRALSKIVACGILNTAFKLRFSNLFASWLRKRLTLKDLSTLAAIIITQMQPDGFFLSIRLIGGVKLLTPDKEVESPSGEPSQE